MTVKELMDDAQNYCDHHGEPGVLCISCATKAAVRSNADLLELYKKRGEEITRLCNQLDMVRRAESDAEAQRDVARAELRKLQGKFESTKRENFAALAMQGFITHGGTDKDINNCGGIDNYRKAVAASAVRYADALLSALEVVP